MPITDSIEKQIENVLASETDALYLSERLFSPGGLFSQAADTQGERRAQAQSSLFKQAQRRLSKLQRQEAARFSRSIEKKAGEAIA